MSLELIIKAIIVAQGKQVPHTHDPVNLASIASIDLENSEEKVLGALSGSIAWAGRYPVPKKIEHMKIHNRNHSSAMYDKAPFGNTYINKPNSALGWEPLNEIWQRFVGLFFDVRESTEQIAAAGHL